MKHQLYAPYYKVSWVSYCRYHHWLSGFLLALSCFLLFSLPVFAEVDYRQEARFNGWLEQAKQGDMNAKYHVGDSFEKGRGTVLDVEQARIWYLRAAKSGHIKAIYKLGLFYYKGIGVSVDYKKALLWFKHAAEKGYQPAQFYLGQMYALGKGVHQDRLYALKWITESIQDGYRPRKEELEEIRQVLDQQIKLLQKK